MATVTKEIGLLPWSRGEWTEGVSYRLHNIVTRYGTAFICTADNNSAPCATIDEGGNSWTLGEGWAVFAGSESLYFNTEWIKILVAMLALYDLETEVTLAVGTAGRYVNTDGKEVSDASYSISKPVSVNKGNIYLFPATIPVAQGVSLYARKWTSTFAKVINYTYTYDEQGRPLTAVADYDSSLAYSFAYDGEGVATITDKDGTAMATLPATREVTESRYKPLFNAGGVISVPIGGYYVYLAPFSGEIVVSAPTSGLTGATVLEKAMGLFRSIANNYVGSPGQQTLAQAIAELYARTDAIAGQVTKAEAAAFNATDEQGYRIGGRPLVEMGEGAPSATTLPNTNGIPAFRGQLYIDLTNKALYVAYGTSAISDWKSN